MKPDNLPQPAGFERRFLSQPVELRSEGEGKPDVVRGYAAMFNKRSENLGSNDRPLFEEIAPGAFDDVLGDDVRALFNHDPNLILARSKAGKGTLRLFVDENGLGYEFAPPDTTAGRDLRVSMQRGDVDQSSFGFRVLEDKWVEENNVVVRTIKKVARLFDVSPVTYPAYPDTAVALRSLETFRKAQTPPAPAPSESNQPTPKRAYWERRLGSKSVSRKPEPASP